MPPPDSPLPRRAFLGAELAADSVAFTPAGLQIEGVLPGGMAERAGVRAGDTIVELAGLPVRTLGELAAALRRAGAVATAEIRYLRGAESCAGVAAVAHAPREELGEVARAAGSIDYGELAVPGARLRTIATRAPATRAVVLVVPGIACESIEGEGAPLALLAHGWARAGIESLRFDKRGVGDSEGGPCGALDFETEVADARAALALAGARAAAQEAPLVVFGHSVGGIIAARLAGAGAPTADASAARLAPRVDGVITFGAPASRWLACLVDTTRRQYAMRGAAAEAIERAVDELRALAATTGVNGRSAAYHAQLDAIEPAALWARVAAPVLVVRGEHDWVVRDDDQARIASLVGGPAEIVDLPGLDHVLGWHPDRAASLRDYGAGQPDTAIVPATAAWLEQLARRRHGESRS